MNRFTSRVLASGFFTAAVLALALGAAAQTPAPPAAAPAAKAPRPAHHQTAAAAKAQQGAELKTECIAMQAKAREMRDKFTAMDVALDKLVADMTTAQGSKTTDAMDKPLAAVIVELVAQRKAAHAMMAEAQPEMMAHLMRHMQMHGAKGAMDCPLMKPDNAAVSMAGDAKAGK